MSTVIAKNVQIGTSVTATDNFTIFQPATPDGTLRIGNGNTGITTSQVSLTSAGAITLAAGVTATTGTFSGNLTLGSSVLATPTGSAPSYTCRAWVNFNGTGTVAIRASGNVTSITDNSTGNYTVNFTTAMPDANFSAVAQFNSGVGGNILNVDNYTTTSVGVRTVTGSGAAGGDSATVSVAIFR